MSDHIKENASDCITDARCCITEDFFKVSVPALQMIIGHVSDNWK